MLLRELISAAPAIPNNTIAIRRDRIPARNLGYGAGELMTYAISLVIQFTC